MKRIHLTLVLAVLCVAAFASAAVAGPVGTMEINAGYAKSSTDVTGNNESLGGGISFGAAYWRSATPTIQWGGELSYDNLGSVDVGTTTSVSGKLFRVNPAIRANFGSMVGPSFFAQAGAGYYSFSAKVSDSVAGDASNSSGKFGYNVGAGVGFPVGPKTKMNVLGQYHSVATDGQNTNYFEVKAGVGFGL
jgi:opacity protein-like surface antigen